MLAQLRLKRKEGLDIMKAADKKRKKAERAHRRLVKKATALSVRELALILGMKAQAFVQGEEFDARSDELSSAEIVAQSILDMGTEARRNAARG